MDSGSLQRAHQAMVNNKRALARSILRELILENPHNEQAWLLMAEAVEQQQQAIDCLERVLQINPQNRLASVRLANLLSLMQPQHEAMPVMRSAGSALPVTEEQIVPALPSAERRTIPSIIADTSHLSEGRRGKVSIRRRPNWPLVLGSLLVLLTLILAYFGPDLAMRDPLEMSTIHRVGDEYLIPPYQPGTPGYPLGSDGNGRDLLSRMLWGLRPTLTMVLVVATVRLILGTIIGLMAGWSKGRMSRTLDGIITAALSVPLIIVALGGIAAVGVDLGIWAFIFGLSITGWVETARVVREQTQLVREEVYVEAARAMGASNFSILKRHVLQQIMSLLWMLFAFEISATLMLTATLGFLGYYIGGDVWVAVTDATAAAVSGAPELGQMLATSDVSITRPWGLMAIGAFVFCIVLGFNLLGEGLRKQLSLYGKSGSTRWSRFMAKFNFWFEEHVAFPFYMLRRTPSFRLVMAILLVGAMLAGGIYWSYGRFIFSGDSTQQVIDLQNEHLWSSARRDPFGTLWVQAAGPDNPEISWTFKDETGFSGGPAVASDGTVYLTSQGGILYALTPQGTPLWQVLLAETPVGTPALSQNGEIYVGEANGGLSAYSANGELLWRHASASNQSSMTGPIVSGSGTIFSVMQRTIVALNPQGDLLWEVDPPSVNTSPGDMAQLSPQENLLFWGDVILDAANGEILVPESLAHPDRYFIGADGNIYQVEGHDVIQWDGDKPDSTVAARLTWEYNKFTVARTPEDLGAAPDGTVWLFYTGFARGFGFGEDTRIVWLDEQGELIGNAFHPMRNSQVIGIDEDHNVYACGNLDQGYGDPQCASLSPVSEDALWTLMLEGSHEVAGGALIPGRLYIVSLEGILYAVGLPDIDSTSQQVAGELNDQKLDDMDHETTDLATSEASNLITAGEPVEPKQVNVTLMLEDEKGFSGGPAVADDGTIYILSGSGTFYALNPQAELKWEVTLLPALPVGTPVINADGYIYLSDSEGSVSAYTPEGKLSWRFLPEGQARAISSPVIGNDGTLYFTLQANGGKIQAVSHQGKELWQAELETSRIYFTPEVSPKGDMIFFRDEIFDASTGARLNFELDFEVDQFFAGADGRTYLRAGNTIVEWKVDGTGISLAEERVLLDEHMGVPNDVNVTEEGVVWVYFNSGVLWFARDGKALGSSFPSNSFLTHLAAIDRDFTVYICGRRPANFLLDSKPLCYALSPDGDQPTWEAVLGNDLEDYAGSAHLPGVLYIATEEGHLYKIGGEQ